MFLEPFLFTGGGPATRPMTILLLIYDYAFQNSLGGDYGEATALSVHARGRSWRCCRWLYFRLTDRWSTS